MKNEIKNGVIGAIITCIITAILQFLFIFFFGDDGKIEIVTNMLDDKKYQTIIAVKNMSSDEYLTDIELKINEEIEFVSVEIDGKEIEDSSKIYFKNIGPKSVSVIKIISDKEITSNDIVIVKNGLKITSESFNNSTNYKILYLIIVISYSIINFIIGLWFEYKNSKEYEMLKEKSDEAINESKKLKEECEKNELKLAKIEKNIKVNKVVFLKEMNDLEKEKQFYQKLLLKKMDGAYTKDDFEKLITKELKLFNKKKIKHLSYDDIFDVVDEIVEIRDKSIKNG